MDRIVGYLGRRLDLLGGIVMCLMGAVIVAISYGKASSTVEMGMALLVASAIYLLFRKKMADSSSPSLPSSTSLTLVLNIIFISAFGASVFVTQSSLYRPPLYFLLISISAAVVAAEILSSESKAQTWLLLLKILLISLSLRAGLFYELPGFTGADAWLHVAIIETWIDGGHISHAVPTLASGWTGYAAFPVMHLAVVETRIITSLNPKDSLFLSVGIFNIVSSLFIFLIGQRLIDRRGGLLATLFISLTAYHIVWGAILIPNSLGIWIFAMMLFLVFKSTSNVTHSLLFVVTSVTLVLTHTISAFIASIALVLILIANEVYKKLDKVNIQHINITDKAVMLFVVLMLTRWIYCFFSPSQSFIDVILGPFINALRMDVEFVGTVIYEESAATLSRVWFLMFMGFIAIGSLFWLSRKMRRNSRIAIIAGTLGLSIIVFVFPVLHIGNLLPWRWVTFVLVIGAVLAAQGTMAMSGMVNGKIKKAVLVVIVIFAFSMFSINSSLVNMQTPFYKEHSRPAFIQSELSAADTISRIYDGIITTDWDYAELPFRTQTGLTQFVFLRNEIEDEGLIVIRRYLYLHQHLLSVPKYGEAPEEVESIFFTKFDSYEYDLIYNNGEVGAHLKKEW